MTHFLVTGVSGLLGLNFALAVDGKKHQVTGVANTSPMLWATFNNVQLELTRPGAVEEMLATHKPEVMIHCAAMANVDACENDPALAYQVNAVLPGTIAAACRQYGVRLIHISTDAVFDGSKGNYQEEDKPNPLSVYASTKLEGEKAVLDANPDALIARVNFYGWSAAGNRSLAENFVRNLEAGKEMMGFTDVIFCPMNILDLSSLLVETAALEIKGIYHMVGASPMSKYQFGMMIAERFGFNPALIKPVSVSESGLKAARSPNLSLSVEKLRNALGHDLPEFDEGLRKFFDQYRRGYPQYIMSLN
ncbi:MAG TPA: SDR family oxidoreductase [Anaerolineaceae bacterium]|nr:SDR family oxidoreductase [Anaerolineaceae bacterium]